MSNQLPDPRLTQVYRLEATLAQPLDLGDIAQGHRRIAPLTGGTFTGPELNGKLLPGAVRTSVPASTPSAPQRRSRPPPPVSTG
jgi:hypothetical protein